MNKLHYYMIISLVWAGNALGMDTSTENNTIMSLTMQQIKQENYLFYPNLLTPNFAKNTTSLKHLKTYSITGGKVSIFHREPAINTKIEVPEYICKYSDGKTIVPRILVYLKQTDPNKISASFITVHLKQQKKYLIFSSTLGHETKPDIRSAHQFLLKEVEKDASNLGAEKIHNYVSSFHNNKWWYQQKYYKREGKQEFVKKIDQDKPTS